MRGDLAALAVPLSVLTFVLLLTWHNRRRVLRHAAEREALRQSEGADGARSCRKCGCKEPGAEG